MRRLMLLGCSVLIVVLAGGCLVQNPGPAGLYRGIQPDLTPVVTPKASPVTWGSAPAIDENYGGTLYAGTSIEQQDPRPALLPGGLEPLRLWVADPGNGIGHRAAIVWLHGGGFAVGIDSMYGLANGTAKEYAQRGYVGFSVEYRTDTTLIGAQHGSNRPPSLCQWVQDNIAPDDPVWIARKAQCKRNIVAAQHDSMAAVRWIREHADQYGIDPTKVAVGGFSAGAVTAVNMAYRGEDVGDLAYYPGDTLSAADSRPQASFGASGCLYSDDLGTPTEIEPSDGPVSLIHSKFDAAVPYDCAAQTVTAARNLDLVAELTSYCNESGHAAVLYNDHKQATDDQWTTYLVRELQIYNQPRPPSTDPVC